VTNLKLRLTEERIFSKQSFATISLSFSHDEFFEVWEIPSDTSAEKRGLVFGLLFFGDWVIVQRFHRHVHF
jgi:hypothetical protein